MAYGLIYQGEFSSVAENDYRLEILRKDYSGPYTTLQMAAAPVVHSWGTDEIKGVVKGSSLSITYLNKGSNPVENFISNNSDEFKVIFYQGANVLFVGFLVQDDFREPMLDYTHEVQISANDNLGLLKDVALDKNPLTATAYNPTTAEGDFIAITVPSQNWIYLRNSSFVPAVGVAFTISGHPVPNMNQTFTPTVVDVVSAGNYNVRTNTFTGDAAASPVSINGNPGIFDFYARNSLLSAIAVCLQNTGLQLNTYVYENLYEQFHNTSTSSLEQTLIDFQTFIAGENFDNCYSVLSKICDRFNITIFQALGRWNIIRWDELRLGAGINGFIYDSEFVLTGTTTLDTGLLFGFNQDTYPETGLYRSLLSPFDYVKETFNYKQPKYLLNNYDLQNLGALIRQYTTGVITYYEYVAPGFKAANYTPLSEFFIRIAKDSVGYEIERSLVIKGGLGANLRAVECVPFEIIQGDKMKFNLTFQTNVSQGGPLTLLFAVKLVNGATVRYIGGNNTTPGPWGVSAYSYILPIGNTNMAQSVVIESQQAPFTGLVYCYITQCVFATNATSETWIKDIRLEYTPYINDSTKIIGHVHNDSQNVGIKNNESSDIYMDDSTRNSIQGTLFRKSITNLLQDRTKLWHRSGVAESLKLGEITTREQLQWRSISRTKLEGSFRGLIQSGQHISMLNHFLYNELSGLNFLFGNLQIDYRNDKFNCNAWELFQDGEADVTNEYLFTYLYSTR